MNIHILYNTFDNSYVRSKMWKVKNLITIYIILSMFIDQKIKIIPIIPIKNSNFAMFCFI